MPVLQGEVYTMISALILSSFDFVESMISYQEERTKKLHIISPIQFFLANHPPIPSNKPRNIDYIPFVPLNNHFRGNTPTLSLHPTPSSHKFSRQSAKLSSTSNCGRPTRTSRSTFFNYFRKNGFLYLLPSILHPSPQHRGEDDLDILPKGIIVQIITIDADLVRKDHLVVVFPRIVNSG